MMVNGERQLVLDDLNQGLPAITKEFGAYLAQAGAVCLEDQGHACGVRLQMDGAVSSTYSVQWQAVTEQMRRCCNDLEVTTENGAYGIAFLLVHDLSDYTIIERSRKGTGFDYWLGTKGDLPFNNKARLEVSGIRKGDDAAVDARLKIKSKQADKSNTNLPAYIVVVEFGKPKAKVVKNEPSS